MPDEQNSTFGTVPQSSEAFGTIPHASESFGNVPNVSEGFRNVPKAAERKENHILTVREVARMFEAAGVSRTERSITNWCKRDEAGFARLDSYFDSNDRKFFITPQSVDAAIKEELAKAAQHASRSESLGSARQASEEEKQAKRTSEGDSEDVRELRFKLRESEISSKVKDQVIARLEKDNREYVAQLIEHSRLIGQLETQLQLEAPGANLNEPRRIRVASENQSSSERP